MEISMVLESYLIYDDEYYDFGYASEGIGDVFSSIITKLKNLASSVLEKIRNIIGKIKDFFSRKNKRTRDTSGKKDSIADTNKNNQKETNSSAEIKDSKTSRNTDAMVENFLNSYSAFVLGETKLFTKFFNGVERVINTGDKDVYPTMKEDAEKLKHKDDFLDDLLEHNRHYPETRYMSPEDGNKLIKMLKLEEQTLVSAKTKVIDKLPKLKNSEDQYLVKEIASASATIINKINVIAMLAHKAMSN